uniref:Uncharacterized protein n=1 Tax=Anopheles coluzzii TaxID=1518534 RepID=A0A8W7PRJ5_ANOCL
MSPLPSAAAKELKTLLQTVRRQSQRHDQKPRNSPRWMWLLRGPTLTIPDRSSSINFSLASLAIKSQSPLLVQSVVHSGVIRWCSISEQQWYAKYLTNKIKRKTTSAKSARLPTPYSEHLTGVHAALVQAACYVDATDAVPAGRINRCRTAPRKTHSGTPMTQTGTASGAQRNLSRQVGP